jgi:hypothetical protein
MEDWHGQQQLVAFGAAATKARPMPVLPEVGSTMVMPGLSTPRCSASQIMLGADPALHRITRIAPLDLGQNGHPSRPQTVDANQRGVADGFGVVGEDVAHRGSPEGELKAQAYALNR